ncbi:hypothetical protein B5X24_HaOG206316 [Helicoverpa armigera]|nr:hypothetical protein B5X24_HaOG206316 [Helicoverpa armigera]
MDLSKYLFLVCILVGNVSSESSVNSTVKEQCPNVKTSLVSVRKRRHLAFPPGSACSSCVSILWVAMPRPVRAASGRCLRIGPSQGQPKGPSQGQTMARDASASETSRAPSAASLMRDSDVVSTDLSDTESQMSGTSGVATRQTRKRAFLKRGSGGSSDAAEKPAKRAILQANLEEQPARRSRAKANLGASSVLYADHTVEEMERMALEDQMGILEVASKSSNLKGTLQKALKCRAASLLGIVKELVQRTTSEETRQLQAKVDRLQKEVSALHARVPEPTNRQEGTSEGPTPLPPSSILEDIIRKVVMEERAFTRACFAGIEDRLLPETRLRPPLAADKAPGRMPIAPGPSTVPAQAEPQVLKTTKGKKTSPAPATQTFPPEPVREDVLLPSTTPSNQPWIKVVKRKQKGKRSAPEPPAVKPAALADKRRKLAPPPRTAAVVVTLTPEAAERGETYESVLRRARTNVDPAELGAGRVTCRKTQTGARIFQFSGAQRGTKADLFATKLREAISDTAKVVRAVKCVTLEDWLSPSVGVRDVDATAVQLRVSLTEVCNSSMPRSHRPPPRRAVYWWSEELGDLRAACVAARRAYTRSRRRRLRDLDNEDRLYTAYKEAKSTLTARMGTAQDRARAEMFEGLDIDPFGRPYKAACNKLRPYGPPVAETLEPSLLDRVVQSLFPRRDNFTPPVMSAPRGAAPSAEEVPLVTENEVERAASCLRGKKTAPDDTLLTARGRNFAEAASLASAGGSLVVDRISRLGLTVALQKTEAVFFHGPRQHQPPDAHIHVEGVRIGVQPQMKYLGIVLDSKWHFSAHFSGLSTRLMKTASALSWLLPNIGRPGDQCRRLYAGILKSMALYGAPIWADSLCRRRNAAAIRRPQRVIAQRVARAYRTVSFAAACVLAGTPPWELEAWVLARVYDWKAAQRALDRHPDPIEREEVREEARELITGHWAEDLASATFGRRTLDAIGPVLNGWLDRRHGCLSMRLVQVLSGHGCFGSYLHRIGREETPQCHHCEAEVDSTEHTLEVTTSVVKTFMTHAPSGWYVVVEAELVYMLPDHTIISSHLRRKLHHRQKKEIWETLESMFQQRNMNGRACVIRTICEARQNLAPKGKSLVHDILRAMFTAPLHERDFIEEMGMTYTELLDPDFCEKANDCPLSVLGVILDLNRQR